MHSSSLTVSLARYLGTPSSQACLEIKWVGSCTVVGRHAQGEADVCHVCHAQGKLTCPSWVRVPQCPCVLSAFCIKLEYQHVKLQAPRAQAQVEDGCWGLRGGAPQMDVGVAFLAAQLRGTETNVLSDTV